MYSFTTLYSFREKLKLSDFNSAQVPWWYNGISPFDFSGEISRSSVVPRNDYFQSLVLLRVFRARLHPLFGRPRPIIMKSSGVL